MKYYIETTIPSFYYDTRRSLEILSRRHWTRRWWETPKIVTPVQLLESDENN